MAKAIVATSNQTAKSNLHNRFPNQNNQVKTALSIRVYSRDFRYLSAILIHGLPLIKVTKVQSQNKAQSANTLTSAATSISRVEGGLDMRAMEDGAIIPTPEHACTSFRSP